MADSESRKREEIQARSEVIVDGDLSDEKIDALTRLQREEESLDYKETLDLSSGKRAKVDIVCDIASMANTRGGYIIVGVKEDEGKTFTVEGASEACIGALDQANIQNWLQTYIDATLHVVARTALVSDGKQVVAICVSPARVPVPFRRNGQYDGPGRRSVTKFSAGELFVRHGSKSERAAYEDWIRLTESIRQDERNKMNPAGAVLSRLDTITELLGGARAGGSNLALTDMSDDDVEDYFFRFISAGNTIELKRGLRKQFRRITSFLHTLEDTKTLEELVESLDRTFLTFLQRLLPAWVCVIEADSDEVAGILVKNLEELYAKSADMSFARGTGTVDGLWLQSHIVYVVYCLGALAVAEDKPRFAQILFGDEVALPGVHEGVSWFRHVLTMQSRAGRLPSKSLCATSLEFLRNREYVVEQFGDTEKLTDALCQFDFLQCAHALRKSYMFTKERIFRGCYPSFGAYYKTRITPIVTKIMRTREKAVWLSQMNDEELCTVIDTLDRYATQEFFVGVWDYGGWPPEIQSFIDANRPDVQSREA